MSFDAIQTGSVIRFPYLWAREAADGEAELRKPCPVAVDVRIPKPNGDDVLLLFTITNQKPDPDRFAAEIPDTEKRRSGLDAMKRLWIVLDEYNQDVIGQSFYIEPEPPLGRFSKVFFLPLLKEIITRRSKSLVVQRSSGA